MENGVKIFKKILNTCHLQKKPLLALTLLKQYSVICFYLRRIFWITSSLPEEALLKMDFRQKIHNSAMFEYFKVKIIRNYMEKNR